MAFLSYFLYFFLFILPSIPPSFLFLSCYSCSSPPPPPSSLKTFPSSPSSLKPTPSIHQGHGYKFGYEITDPHGAKNSRHESDDGHGNKVCCCCRFSYSLRSFVRLLLLLLSMLIINFKKHFYHPPPPSRLATSAARLVHYLRQGWSQASGGICK